MESSEFHRKIAKPREAKKKGKEFEKEEKKKNEKKRKKKGASDMTRSRDTFKSPSGRFQSVVITSGDGKKQGPSSFAVWPTRWSRVEKEKRLGAGRETMIVSHEPN